MKKTKDTDETVKSFEDYSFKSWFTDGDTKIKVGDDFPSIMKGEAEILEVKETIIGHLHNTFRIVITEDNKIYLLKLSRELK
jgi:hypothetical protein